MNEMRPVGAGYFCNCGTRDIDETCRAGLDCCAVKTSGHFVVVDGALRFKSDKYPSCPPGKVPLSVDDQTAQIFLWEYAQIHRIVDAGFSNDLEVALIAAGFVPPPTWKHLKRGSTYMVLNTATAQSAEPIKEGEQVEVYASKPNPSEWHVRRKSEYHDGRFEKIK